MNKHIIVGSLIILLLVFIATGCVKIVKIGEEEQLVGEMSSDIDNVDEIWDSKIIPELSKKAVDLGTLLIESKGDLKSVADKYGKTSTTSNEICYTVKGTAKVEKINNEMKAGFMEVSLDDYSGPVKIKMQIGSVYKGTAVRDSLDFIKYEDYKNQVEWAAISQNIHDIVQKKVIEPLDLTSLPGKTIEFIGCFFVSENGQNEVLITPVKLTVK